MNTDGSQFRCPYCGSSLPPTTISKVSSAGWALFWILLLFLCFPLFWIGLLIQDHFSKCSACGMILGQTLPPPDQGWVNWKEFRVVLILIGIMVPLALLAVYLLSRFSP